MPLESSTSLASLNSLWPLGSDGKSQGDDHLRLLKSVLKTQFPGAGGIGFSTPIIATEVEINRLTGVTVNIQAKFDLIDATYTPKPLSPISDAPYVLRDGSWVVSQYRIKSISAATANTNSYNAGDFVRILYSGPVVITAGAVTSLGKCITFEKANGTNSVTFVDGDGTVYGPDLTAITEEGKVFCLVATDTNEWRLIV
jgi:hypothetical protein